MKHYSKGRKVPGGPDGNGMGTHPYHEPSDNIMAMGHGGLKGPQGSYKESSTQEGGRDFGVKPDKCSGCME